MNNLAWKKSETHFFCIIAYYIKNALRQDCREQRLGNPPEAYFYSSYRIPLFFKMDVRMNARILPTTVEMRNGII